MKAAIVIMVLLSWALTCLGTPTRRTAGAPAPNPPRKKLTLEKIPKSLFLIKKAKVNADVGEPQFYPADAQLRTVINDPILHNLSKFE